MAVGGVDVGAAGGGKDFPQVSEQRVGERDQRARIDVNRRALHGGEHRIRDDGRSRDCQKFAAGGQGHEDSRGMGGHGQPRRIYVAHWRVARRELHYDRRRYPIAASALAPISMANRSSSFDQAGPPRPAGRKRNDGSNSCSPDERSDIREQPRRSPSGMDRPPPHIASLMRATKLRSRCEKRAPLGALSACVTTYMWCERCLMITTFLA